jgi:antitoxin CptB
MSAADAPTELENRRKRLLYQSIYRGNKENDIILGRFARAHLGEFGAEELDQYEKLLANGDNDIFDWLSGRADVPPEKDSAVLRKLMRFRVDLSHG